MRASWRAEEFRGVRAALCVASALGWALWIAEPLRELRAGADASLVLMRLTFGLSLTLLVHAGLFISLKLEREKRALRVFAAVVMLPNVLFAGGITAFVIDEGFWSMGEYAFSSVLLLPLHLAQLWALSGIPFPRLRRLTLGLE